MRCIKYRNFDLCCFFNINYCLSLYNNHLLRAYSKKNCNIQTPMVSMSLYGDLGVLPPSQSRDKTPGQWLPPEADKVFVFHH